MRLLTGHFIVYTINTRRKNYEEEIQADKPGLCQLCRKDVGCHQKDDGVSDATVSFLMQKLTIDADEARFDAIMQEVAAVCKKVEPDCEINL